MKFKIEIELENGDYCNGCPLFIETNTSNFISTTYWHNCRADYYKEKNISESQRINGFPRPDICKEQNKEKTEDYGTK